MSIIQGIPEEELPSNATPRPAPPTPEAINDAQQKIENIRKKAPNQPLPPGYSDATWSTTHTSWVTINREGRVFKKWDPEAMKWEEEQQIEQNSDDPLTTQRLKRQSTFAMIGRFLSFRGSREQRRP
ncbi:hypothetical protein GJ744_007146 [Endocarpon pusillum]|uniref:Uncharacterized protein n=1 Tax=Endocarpon pusillum TaxID=364733 RepID=A0A8H7E5G6_9EURO|nr:hypothetical protein GJ744_007146 [Endocarpon pusillum]